AGLRVYTEKLNATLSTQGAGKNHAQAYERWASGYVDEVKCDPMRSQLRLESQHDSRGLLSLSIYVAQRRKICRSGDGKPRAECVYLSHCDRVQVVKKRPIPPSAR